MHQQPRRQVTRILTWIFVTLAVLALLTVIVVIVVGYGYTHSWTGFSENRQPMNRAKEDLWRAKTLWDWLQLLIVPVVLAVIAFLFSWAEKRNDRLITQQRTEEDKGIARRRTQDATLQSYLDQVAQLLLHKEDGKVSKAHLEDDVRAVIRARTLTVLDGLVETSNINLDQDQPHFRRKSLDRKRSLLQFLYEADLIDRKEPVIDLRGANLRDAYLREVTIHDACLRKVDLGCADLGYTDLKGVNLSEANLGKAQLNDAKLQGVNFEKANVNDANFVSEAWEKDNTRTTDLTKAVLDEAHLMGSDLRGTTLVEASINNTNLAKVDLRGASVTVEQLAMCKTLSGATMPDGWSNNSQALDLEGDLPTLRGLQYPATKENLISAARVNNAPNEFIVLLLRLSDSPDVIYTDSNAVSRTLKGLFRSSEPMRFDCLSAEIREFWRLLTGRHK